MFDTKAWVPSNSSKRVGACSKVQQAGFIFCMSCTAHCVFSVAFERSRCEFTDDARRQLGDEWTHARGQSRCGRN